MIELQVSITYVNTFADRLRSTRIQRGLTQAQLALASGLSQSAIANYERGSRRMPQNIFPLAHALQVDAQWLAEGKDSASAALYGASQASSDASARQAASSLPLHEHTRQGSSWPFVQIPPSDYWSLNATARTLIENTVATLIASLRK